MCLTLRCRGPSGLDYVRGKPWFAALDGAPVNTLWKARRVNILGFVCQMVSVAAAQPSRSSGKAAKGNMYMKGRDSVPIKLYLQKRVPTLSQTVLNPPLVWILERLCGVCVALAPAVPGPQSMRVPGPVCKQIPVQREDGRRDPSLSKRVLAGPSFLQEGTGRKARGC